MAQLTRKRILEAATKATGLKLTYIELFKANESDGGTYYWGGLAASYFSESNTHIQKLSDWPLERWICELTESIAEARPSDCLTETFTGFDMNNYIESKHKQ